MKGPHTVYSSINGHLGCFPFSFFGLTRSMWKFPGQALNPDGSCDLCHGCSNTGSLTHCTTAGASCFFLSFFVTKVYTHVCMCGCLRGQMFPFLLGLLMLRTRVTLLQGASWARKMVSSVPGAYPLDASHVPHPTSHDKLKCLQTSAGGKFTLRKSLGLNENT